MTRPLPFLGLFNEEYKPANTQTVAEVEAHINGAERLATKNGWDTVWFSLVLRGDKGVKVILNANDRGQFDAAQNMFVPKPQPTPTRQFQTVNHMVAALNLMYFGKR